MFRALLFRHQGTKILQTVVNVIIIKRIDRNIKHVNILHGSRNSIASYVARQCPLVLLVEWVEDEIKCWEVKLVNHFKNTVIL